MASLPYVTAAGNVKKVLEAIQVASTPDSISQDYVKTVLGIKGGSGNQITSYLKKIGFATPDGKPTDLYTQFRNSSTAGVAATKALKVGYAPLYKRNEYMYKLSERELKGLIIEETGAGKDSKVPSYIVNCIKYLKAFADFDATAVATVVDSADENPSPPTDNDALALTPKPPSGLGMNLSYTINLNLPATSDIAVFNAIFKSLKENLLSNSQ